MRTLVLAIALLVTSCGHGGPVCPHEAVHSGAQPPPGTCKTQKPPMACV